MSSFIGLPGALVEIRSPSQEITSSDRSVSEMVPFSGRRVVQLGRRVRRSWSIDWSAQHPQDYAVLDALTRWSTPLSWVGALAQATNLLTPGQALLEHVSPVRGALELDEDLWVTQWAVGHSSSTVSVTGASPVPVRAGVPLTISAYVQRSDPAVPVQLVFGFRDATGAVVFSTTRDSPPGAQLQRAVWGLTPPAGSVELTVVFRYAAVLAAPQVTWTPGAVPWAPGRGVYRVVVLPGSESPLIAHSRQVLTSAAYTIMEVG